MGPEAGEIIWLPQAHGIGKVFGQNVGRAMTQEGGGAVGIVWARWGLWGTESGRRHGQVFGEEPALPHHPLVGKMRVLCLYQALGGLDGP
jgi:hypothetical protein